jgi:methyl-accepting chemotaxis protein
VTFARRFLIWLTLPPAPMGLPLAILFLTQVEQLTPHRWAALIAAVFVVYAVEVLILGWWLRVPIREVEAAVASGRQVGKALSRALVATENGALAAFGGGVLLFVAVAAAVAEPTWLAARHFFVAGLVLNAPPFVWSYAAAKGLLIKTGRGNALSFHGRRLTIATKIGIIFIGFLVISSAALIQLIATRVSMTLEQLAISSSADRFGRVFESAQSSATVDQATLATLRDYLPADYKLLVITPRSIIGLPDVLTAEETDIIRQEGNGDSSRFTSPHVSIFRTLRNGSILAMTIPWTPYEGIPRQITFYTVIIALLTTLSFILATYFLSRELTRSLRRLTRIAAEMADGNFQAGSAVFSDDEVGELADSFAETGQNLTRLIGKVGGSGAAITDGVRVITGGTETMTRRAHEQTSLTTSSTEALENVRAGIESLVEAAGGVEGLTQDSASRALELQASAEEVARSMDVLFQSVEKTSSSTTEMDASASEMSKRTEVLAGIGDEVLTFVAEMEATAEELRQNAHATADLSRKVEEDAAQGGSAVGETLDGISRSQQMTEHAATVIGELRQSVGTISQILTVIEEIADRTNLLSLNAAIIAAQAGEHGAGFTVVADEIRQLAERTRGSTKEISGIIKAIQAGSREAMSTMEGGVALVNENVTLARNAATSLEKIVTSAGRSYEMANKISRALQDQAEASRHLHQVSSRMSDHISEINRSTTEQARGTRLMAEEAERVRDIAFQVKSSTEQQSQAGRGITAAMEQISGEVTAMRNLLQAQLEETEQIAEAARTMRVIAEENETIAADFNRTLTGLTSSATAFDAEVRRFKIGE